ncbi:MAG TPA: FHA domain-containing protein, partial [Sedimenticola sp.]|nr:FHA domain-containing protein [Sedimenticola sp.]
MPGKNELQGGHSMRQVGERQAGRAQAIGKLVISRNDTVLEEYELGARKITIGRDSSSNIQLNELSVSRHHACLTRVYNDYFVEDLKSTNGTFLNHRQITKHMLKHDDILRIGGFTLRMVGAMAGDGDEDLDRTLVLSAVGARGRQ